jgi:hypothetical protein
MNNTTRHIIAILGAMALAALATPELAAYLPQGLAQLFAVIVGAGLHALDAKAPEPPA